MPLLGRDDSVLIVIDAQPGFSGADDVSTRGAAHAREVAAWLVGVASALGIPIVVTEEDAGQNGPTDPWISRRLPAGTQVFDKTSFGLTGSPEILAAVESTGRRTAVLVGAETDVCVAQSAIGLLHLGLRVAAVTDATFSPGDAHEHGLRRMHDAGVEIHSAKGVYYEWVRTLAAARAFVAGHPELANPPGFAL